jgi:hypothetical protein
MDVDIVDTTQTHEQAAAEYVQDQDLDSAAIPSEFNDLEDQKEAVVQTAQDMRTARTETTATVTVTVTTVVDKVIETVFIERCRSS